MDSDSRQAILGSIDFIDHVQIRGWAKDDRSSKSAVKLVIIVADKILGRLNADLFRQDLKDAGTPSNNGAGVKGKIIESLAAGVPCVFTTVAAECMRLCFYSKGTEGIAKAKLSRLPSSASPATIGSNPQSGRG